jgi:hypothetical protein
MQRWKFRLALIAITMSVPSVATAQFETLASLAGGFSDLGLSWGPFIPIHNDIRPERDPAARALHWYGAEFLFEIGKTPTEQKTGCTVERDKATERHINYSTIGAGAGGSTRIDSVDIYNLKKKCPSVSRVWQLELGVGYSETSRFRISTPGGDVSGLLRETPSVSVYANYVKLAGCDGLSIVKRLRVCWDQYVGLHTGVTALVDPSLTPPIDAEFSGGSPKSVQIGGLIGMANDLFPVLTAFSEVGYVYRPFPRITWSRTGATAPATARTRLDLSAWLFSFGLQLRVKDPKKE